jgi:hypothetical protein
MRTVLSAAALAFILTGAAVAQGTTSPGSTASPGSGATKMSAAECTSSWNQLDTGKSGKVSETQAKSMVTDFSSADTNKDGNLTQTEFMDACEKGLVTAAAGSGTGSRGMTGSDDKTPGSGTTSPGSTGGSSK